MDSSNIHQLFLPNYQLPSTDILVYLDKWFCPMILWNVHLSGLKDQTTTTTIRTRHFLFVCWIASLCLQLAT